MNRALLFLIVLLAHPVKLVLGFNFTDENCYVRPNIDHSTTDYFKHPLGLEPHNYAWIAAGVCVVIACVLSFYLIFKHTRNYTKPEFQKHIIRILLMVPIYAIDSFLSFRFYWLSVYFDIVRDCYEAFVIYTFYSLLISFVGGYEHGKEIFSKRGNIKLAMPLCCVEVHPRRGLLRQCKRMTLQYVIIRPSMTLLAIILHSTHQYCPGNYSPYHGYVYVTIVNFFSVTVAMYALVQFYSISRADIAPYKPIPKFLSIKFVIFLSFWQSIAVSGFVTLHGIKATTYWSTDNIATGIQDACTCFEMLIAAIWHIWAFSYKDFDTGKRTNIFKAFWNAFNPKDIVIDVYHSFFPESIRNRPKKKSGGHEMDLNTSVEMESKSITAYEVHEREGEGEGEGESKEEKESSEERENREDAV